jgi:hypothetical protein
MPHLVSRRPKRNKNKKITKTTELLGRREHQSHQWNTRSGAMPLLINPRWNNKPYHLVRSFNLSTIITTNAATVSFAGVYFTLTNVDLTDGLNTVFDQYRILLVECFLMPFPGVTATQEVLESSQWASSIDWDNATPPTAYAQVLNSPSAQWGTAANSHLHVWRPDCALGAYAGAFTSYANVTSPWIDCVSSAVQHFGIKIAALPSTSNYTIVGGGRFTLQFRNVI